MLTFNRRLNTALSAVTAVVMVLMVLHIIAHALMRHLFNTPLYGTNEIVAFWYLPFVALLGIPAAQLQKEHISVTLVTDRLGAVTARIFLIFGEGLAILTSIGFAWFGFHEAIGNAERKSTAGVTDIMTYPMYFLVPIVFVLLALLYLLDIILMMRTGRRAVDPTTGEPTAPHIDEAVL